MNNLKGIIFDLDGTLVDSMGFLTDIACQVICSHFGLSAPEAAKLYKETSGNPFGVQLQLLFPNHAKNEAALSLFDQLKIERYFQAPFFEDVFPVLHALKNHGYRLYVSSNNDEAIVFEKIKGLDIAFDAVLGMRPGFLKGRAHFDFIKALINDTRLLFVGDSLHDSRVSAEARIPFFARLGTFTKQQFLSGGFAHASGSNLYELLDFLTISTKPLQVAQ